MLRGTLAGMVSAALLALPSVAQAGIVTVTENVPEPNASCTDNNCPTYDFTGSTPPGAIHIAPRTGNTRTKHEAGYYDFRPPDPWPHAAVQGWQLQLDGINAAMGANWRVVMCVPNGAGSVCGGNAAVVWPGGPSLTYTLGDPGQTVRVAVQYIGDTGGPVNSGLIHLDAQVRWVEVDNQAPGLGVTVGERPLADGMLVGGDEPDISVTATDNTAVAGGAIAVDGVETPYTGDVPPGVTLRDGRHQVGARACDIAAPQNCTGAAATVSVDTVAPRVTLLSPLAVDTQKPVLEVRALDPEVNAFRSGVTSASLRLGEKPAAADVKSEADKIRLTPKDPIPEGRHPLEVQVLDAAGNVGGLADPASTATPPELVVDLQPPSAAPGAPLPNARVRREPLEITAALTDSVGIVSSQMLLDGQVVQAQYSEGTIGWLYEDPCPGRHEVEVTGADAIGRTAATRWGFTVEGELSGLCARKVCAEAKIVMSRAKREARFDLKARRRNIKSLRRAKTKAARAKYRRNVRRWTVERRRDLRRYSTAKRRAKNACRIARRES